MTSIIGSSRMEAYLSVIPDKTSQKLKENEVNGVSRISPFLNLPLSDEEKEQQLGTVDNGVKTVDLLNRSKTDRSASEKIGVTRGLEDKSRFIEKLYNCPYEEVEKLNMLCNGVDFYSGYEVDTGEALESTPENPIMFVLSGNRNQHEDGNDKVLTWYKVYVNQVDPRSATREEMIALITYEYKGVEDPEALIKATYAWSGSESFVEESDGKADWVKALQSCCDWAGRLYKSGDARFKRTYEALTDLLDTLDKRTKRMEHSEQVTKPSQATLYHKIAEEKAKTKIQ